MERLAAKNVSNAPNLKILVWIKRTQSYIAINTKDITIGTMDRKLNGNCENRWKFLFVVC